MKKLVLSCLITLVVACMALVVLNGSFSNRSILAQDATKAGNRPITKVDPPIVDTANAPFDSPSTNRNEFDPFSVSSQPPRNRVPGTFGQPVGISPGQVELHQLRDEYIKIAQSKAALMTVDELRKAVGVARTEFAELRAAKELQSAIGNLNKIIKQYPDSKAAKTARRLLGQPNQDEGGEGAPEEEGGEAAAEGADGEGSAQ